MIYLVGGPARCGKSTLAARICARRGIAWTGTDVVRVVLQPLVPALVEADEHGDFAGEAELFYPHLERAVSVARAMAPDYLIEGIGFGPDHAARLNDGHDDVRACFLGRLACAGAEIVGPSRNRWIDELSPAQVEDFATAIARTSRELHAACAAARVAFVDVSAGFDAGLERAEQLLFDHDR